MDGGPDCRSRGVGLLKDNADHSKVSLVVLLDPVDEEADHVVRCDRGTTRVGQQLLEEPSLLLGSCLIPHPKALSDEPEILFALDALPGIVPELIEPTSDLVD